MAKRSTPQNPEPEGDPLTKAWTEKPDTIKAFLDQRPQYEQLCSEIAYILGKMMDRSGIEYSAITARAKTLNSFLEKLERKTYEAPLDNVTDFAGVRLVYLYKSDQGAIEKLVEAEFEVVEKVDKIEEQEADKFGYGALHYLIRLGQNNSGARYDDLKGLICELQVRTVLQDAWSIIDHHLVYKHEADVPKRLRRRLNSVAGLFETADDQFDQVRIQREEYVKSVKDKTSDSSTFLDQDLNLDTFAEYLRWKYPELEIGHNDTHASSIFNIATRFGYTRLKELDSLLTKAAPAVKAFREVVPTIPPTGAGNAAVALALAHPAYLAETRWRDYERDGMAKVQSLFSS